MDIHPKEQNIDKVFSGTNYYIDFYQREYKWNKEQIGTLLDDIFYKFNQEYRKELDVSQSNIEDKYSWYYLNTYVTNEAEGKTFIVDGQQRLTSISLMLIVLYHLAGKKELRKDRLDWLETKLYGASADGRGFWIGHGKRKDTMKYLFDNKEVTEDIKGNSITEENIIKNYKIIYNYLLNSLDSNHKLETFILYFLLRVVIIKLDVSRTDVPMVFEVINDRGVRLKPYEILKGKLLGQIDKNEVSTYSTIWEKSISAIERESEKSDIVDIFFRTYFKAKFSRNRADARKLDGTYHRVIFDSEFNRKLGLKNNPAKVKSFLASEFSFFINLYRKIEKYAEVSTEGYEYVYFNSLNEMDTQSMLILSVCKLNDPEKNEKIKEISRLIDKLFVLLQLNQSYDSNRFVEIVYELMGKLKDKEIKEYDKIFEEMIVDEVSRVRHIEAKSLFIPRLFNSIGYPDFNKRFLRYFFTRIEYFLTQNTKQKMSDDVWNLTRGTGDSTSYHIEHILGMNKENMQEFNDDDELFETQRNRMGAILLLKGRDNQSSGNERYAEKLKSYAGTLMWNESLTEEFYKSKLDRTDFIKKYKFDFCSIEKFDKASIDRRTNLLFSLVKEIWK